MEEYRGIYQGSRPVTPGINMWYMRIELDNGETKILRQYFDYIDDCRKSLNLKVGDRLRIIENPDNWNISKV